MNPPRRGRARPEFRAVWPKRYSWFALCLDACPVAAPLACAAATILVARGRRPRSQRSKDCGSRSSLAVDLEVVARDVSLNAGHLALFGLVILEAVFHPHHAFESLSVNVFEDVAVIHLARRRLLPARVVADLEIGDLLPGQVDVRDDIPFGNLLMVHVVKNLDRRAVDSAAYLIGLSDLVQEEPRMIAARVEWLHHHHQPRLLENLGASAEHVNHA